MPASGRAHYGWSSGGRSVGRRRTAQSVAEPLRFSESLSNTYWPCLRSGFCSLSIVAGRALGELMALGSIYASQTGRKVMGREARDLAGSKL